VRREVRSSNDSRRFQGLAATSQPSTSGRRRTAYFYPTRPDLASLPFGGHSESVCSNRPAHLFGHASARPIGVEAPNGASIRVERESSNAVSALPRRFACQDA
jgi:hypothetical protein